MVMTSSHDLFNIYTADMPNTANTIVATYVDDTAILFPGTNLRCITKPLESNWTLVI